MKSIFLFFFISIIYSSNSQCEKISMTVWQMVKNDDYHKVDSLLLPIEKQRKIQHWPNEDSSNIILKQLRDTLIKQIVFSGKILKSHILSEKFDLKKTHFSRCEMDKDGEVIVHIKDKINDYSFNFHTLLIDKLYLVLPINEKSLPRTSLIVSNNKKNNQITCTDNHCEGTYKGKEFINGSDVAHQFSNTMSAKVGDQLKALYKAGKYSKVDFDKIIMTTKGMGSGTVTYYLKMPFIRVTKKCDAYTSFDHVGGWNHTPALSQRKVQLKSALMKGHQLNISTLKTTKEGLQEYWIQWQNKVTQAECE